MSPTPRDAAQLAATYCDVGHRPASEEVLEKALDAGDQRRELSIQGQTIRDSESGN